MKVALIQMESVRDKDTNLKVSLSLAAKALEQHPDMIIFPEYQMFQPDYGNPESTMRASEYTDGSFVSQFAKVADQNGVSILLNISERASDNLKPYNTSVLIDDMGLVSSKYRKLHLFDAYSHMESGVYQMGRMPLSPAETVNGTLGLQICYDLRFPEGARILRLSGATIISYQAGWFAGDRKLDTWRILLRSRAMENGAFVLGTAQCGPAFTGHTMAVSPYGDILGELDNSQGVLVVDLDMSLPEKYLEDVPLIKQRRKDIYDVSGI